MKVKKMSEEYAYTLRQLAELFKVKPAIVAGWALREEISSIRDENGMLLFKTTEVDDLLAVLAEYSMSTNDVKELAGVSFRQEVIHWATRGKLPYIVLITGDFRFRLSDVEAFLTSRLVSS